MTSAARGLPGIMVPDLQYVSPVALVGAVLDTSEPGLLLDIGAGSGADLATFAAAGWTVHAFEPDGATRDDLASRLAADWDVTIDARAVGSVDAWAPIFRHDRVGSSLVQRDDSAGDGGTVEVITATAAVEALGWRVPDVVVVSTAGWEREILRAYPWASALPRAVVVYTDDDFTPRLGFSSIEVARLLEAHGYDVFAIRHLPTTPTSAVQRVGRAADTDGSPVALLAFRPGATDVDALEHRRGAVVADREHRAALEQLGLRVAANPKQTRRLQARVRELERELDAIRRSTSWRVGHRIVVTAKRAAAPWRRLQRAVRRAPNEPQRGTQ